MKIEIFYCRFNAYYKPKDSESNVASLKQLRQDVENIFKEHPDAKVEWLQSFAGTDHTQITAVVSY